jgi:UDP-N-acetylmuramoyl-L-alanyl-D-glutamate--2,6-diaminopimelate ligase
VRARNACVSLEGIRAEIVSAQESFGITSRLVGVFNLYNIAAAAAVCRALGIGVEAVQAGITQASGVPGRMERVENDLGILVFVDYAHTADALAQVLATLRDAGAETIITVFGCGGDRDRGKRPEMGSAAGRLSTRVILTSDNPRSEDPESIIAQIEPGLLAQGFVRADAAAAPGSRKGLYCIEPDRRQAIRQAIFSAAPGDVVLIAGKGHETTQQFAREQFHFDDREEARAALKMCARHN